MLHASRRLAFLAATLLFSGPAALQATPAIGVEIANLNHLSIVAENNQGTAADAGADKKQLQDFRVDDLAAALDEVTSADEVVAAMRADTRATARPLYASRLTVLDLVGTVVDDLPAALERVSTTKDIKSAMGADARATARPHYEARLRTLEERTAAGRSDAPPTSETKAPISPQRADERGFRLETRAKTAGRVNGKPFVPGAPLVITDRKAADDLVRGGAIPPFETSGG